LVAENIGRLSCLSRPLICSVFSYLGVSDHVCLAARLCRAAHNASRSPLSWPRRLDFRKFATLPPASWLHEWGCHPVEELTLGTQAIVSEQVDATGFLCAVGVRCTAIRLVASANHQGSVKTRRIWTESNFPLLQALVFELSGVSRAAHYFDHHTAHLPSLSKLEGYSGDRFQWDPKRLPQLTSLSMAATDSEPVDSSLFPMLRQLELRLWGATPGRGLAHLQALTEATALEQLKLSLRALARGG
jgi:hypothetical protein